jgi:hypothetical protein
MKSNGGQTSTEADNRAKQEPFQEIIDIDTSFTCGMA